MSQYCKKLAFNFSNTALQDFLKIKETLIYLVAGAFIIITEAAILANISYYVAIFMLMNAVFLTLGFISLAGILSAS